MPTGPQVPFMSKTTPALPLARLASNTFWYSGVSGGCWPRPLGLVGSQTPTGLPRFHSPSQLGYLASSALATERHSAAARAAVLIQVRSNMRILLMSPRRRARRAVCFAEGAYRAFDQF